MNDNNTLPFIMPHNKSLKPTVYARHALCRKGKVRATLRRLSSTVLFSKCLMITNSPITPDHILQANKYDANPALCILSGKYGEIYSRFGK